MNKNYRHHGVQATVQVRRRIKYHGLLLFVWFVALIMLSWQASVIRAEEPSFEVLETTFAGGIAQSGNIFDLVTFESPITIRAFDVHTATNSDEYFEIWTLSNSYEESLEANSTVVVPDEWSMFSCGILIGKGLNSPSAIDYTMVTPLVIERGSRIGIYITMIEPGALLEYSEFISENGDLYISDDYLGISGGLGVAYPFQTIYSDRIWNGVVYYNVGGELDDELRFLQKVDRDCRPSASPTMFPTLEPSFSPSFEPTLNPSTIPTFFPTRLPSVYPTANPTKYPTSEPSTLPSISPTKRPSKSPSSGPTTYPTIKPSYLPTYFPSSAPTKFPSAIPTIDPSMKPSPRPSNSPSGKPNILLTSTPTSLPSMEPSNLPTYAPTASPSGKPSIFPTDKPSLFPTDAPTASPSGKPSFFPTNEPSLFPTDAPTALPSGKPSIFLTNKPSFSPSREPSGYPSREPSGYPSREPSMSPSRNPVVFIRPSNFPSFNPSYRSSILPTVKPFGIPSNVPSMTFTVGVGSTEIPTSRPSLRPSENPTYKPSHNFTRKPSSNPTYKPSSPPTSKELLQNTFVAGTAAAAAGAAASVSASTSAVASTTSAAGAATSAGAAAGAGAGGASASAGAAGASAGAGAGGASASAGAGASASAGAGAGGASASAGATGVNPVQNLGNMNLLDVDEVQKDTADRRDQIMGSDRNLRHSSDYRYRFAATANTTGGGMGALRRYISAVGTSLRSSRSSRSGSSQSNDSSPSDSENERRESRIKRLKRSVTKDILWSPWRDFTGKEVVIATSASEAASQSTLPTADENREETSDLRSRMLVKNHDNISEITINMKTPSSDSSLKNSPISSNLSSPVESATETPLQINSPYPSRFGSLRIIEECESESSDDAEIDRRKSWWEEKANEIKQRKQQEILTEASRILASNTRKSWWEERALLSSQKSLLSQSSNASLLSDASQTQVSTRNISADESPKSISFSNENKLVVEQHTGSEDKFYAVTSTDIDTSPKLKMVADSKEIDDIHQSSNHGFIDIERNGSDNRVGSSLFMQSVCEQVNILKSKSNKDDTKWWKVHARKLREVANEVLVDDPWSSDEESEDGEKGYTIHA